MTVIGVDARATEPGFKAHYGRGTGRYAEELLRHLPEAAAHEAELTIRKVLAADLAAKPWEEKLLGLLPFGRQTAHTQFFLPRKLGRVGADLLHFMSHSDGTARCPVPYLVTVLDLIPLRFPELYKADKPDWRFKLARKLENATIAGARGILAISEATKRDVVSILGLAPEKICVTHLGVGERFFIDTDNELSWETVSSRTKERFGLDPRRPMILYTGGIDPRKNITFLLDVFADVLQHSGKMKPQLVLAGAYEKDDQYPKLKAGIERLVLHADIRLLGFVPDSELPALFHAATILAFPSLYEGFGLPVLESMAAGTPVVAGLNSSLPEVGGSAAVLVPDGSRQRWAEEIISLTSDTVRRAALSEAGKTHARAFTWARTALQTVEAYRYFTGVSTASGAGNQRAAGREAVNS